ncbi:amino acid ABC transporter permease [Ornithinimicrobium pekingense]|uniref:Ectoine/hydroxyectoine ABC transporter permease subunit EhuD n=1 Tax=Ornithinimicrobium pekingense TaxID=384677 RepID=A0ABQ2FEU7_9MICO|nr:ABC transporter permease subunit [Ornithinimicrobium pekingense]GGK82937.1 ectoine/hydroxyectoine ABC transporter permease subunit EhuD [Ornithinimicrobium pekingense]
MFETELFLEALPILVVAFLKVTLVVTVASSLLAAVLGLVWAIALRELPGPLARPLAFVLDFIRMTPLPVHLLVIYYAFTGLSPMTVGILVFGVHYSTYMAESYRAGIESIRKGQWEAAKALSLPQSRTWRAVILPQAVRNTLPSLGNWAIAMFKDTPFLIFISVPEMVTRAREFGGQNFSYIEAMSLAGLLFLLASYPTAVLMQKLEKKLAY